MTWQTNVANLVKIGQLKQTPYVEEDVRQYLEDAQAFLQDAEKLDIPRSRFLLAYEGMHALSMAILNKAEVRSDTAEGHRQLAFQTALLIIEIESFQKGSTAAIMSLHRMRNSKTYHSPFPPLGAAVADAAVKALKLMLDATSRFIPPHEAENPNS
jgi:hypothetical protein